MHNCHTAAWLATRHVPYWANWFQFDLQSALVVQLKQQHASTDVKPFDEHLLANLTSPAPGHSCITWQLLACPILQPALDKCPAFTMLS